MLTPEEKIPGIYVKSGCSPSVFIRAFLPLLLLSDGDPALEKSILAPPIVARALSISGTEVATMVTRFQPETRFASRE